MKDAIDFLDRIEGHGYGGTADYEVARTTVRDAAAENERLRGALTKIAAIENKQYGPDWEEIDEAREIAGEALKCEK